MSAGDDPNEREAPDGGVACADETRTSDRRPALSRTVVRYDDRPDMCTIHPPDPADHERATAWITARREDCVSAFAWR